MEVCRICGGTDVLKTFLGNKQLIELLSVCANIEVKEDDYLPKHICEQCEFGLRFSYRLRKQSEETEKRLRQEAMQTQAISTTTNDVQDMKSLSQAEKQLQPAANIISHNIITATTTQQSLVIEKDGTSSDIINNVCQLAANEQSAAQERQVSTSTIETSYEQEQLQQQQMELMNVERSDEPFSERFRLELQQRGVVMSTVKVDILTEPGLTPTVIAEKRIQLDMDNENDYTSYEDDYGLNTLNAGDDNDIIEVIDDESMMYEPPLAPIQNEVPTENDMNINDYQAQDIIEEILSSDEDEHLQTNTTADPELNNIVYEEGDEEYDDDYDESIGIGECQMYITKEEREDIIPYDDEITLDAEETRGTIEEQQIFNRPEENIFNVNSAATDSSIIEKISNYTCPTCDKDCTSQRDYREHIKVHGKERFRCPECNKWFAQRYLLAVHRKTHDNEGVRYKCPQCPLTYQKRCNLTRHIHHKHENMVHICTVCGEKFGRTDILKRHMLTHTDQRDFQCDRCPELFKTKQSLDRHILTHDRSTNANEDQQQSKTAENDSVDDGSNVENDSFIKKSHYCHYCGKISQHHHTHKMHMRIHTQERPHKCEACGKSFRTLAALITHERIHDDARPYQCEHCLLSFRQRGHLSEHRMIHEGIQPHVCSICKLSFTKKYNMLVHMRIHSGEHPYKCVTCGEQFKKSQQLRKHEQKQHSKIFAGDDKTTEEDDTLQEDVEERAFDVEEIVADEEVEEVVGAVELVNDNNESATSFTNLASRLLRSDSDDLEIIDSVTPSPPVAEQIPCNEMTLENVIGAGLEQSLSNVLPGDFHIDNNDVVLVVDDNDHFSSLFIMDD